MGNTTSAKSIEPPQPPASAEKPKLKPCCACPDTKRVRDAW